MGDDTSLVLSKTGKSSHEESIICIQPAQTLGKNAKITDGLCIMCCWMLENLRFISDQLVQFSLDRRDGSPEIEIRLWGTKTLLVHASNEGCRLCERRLLEWYKSEPYDGEEWPIGTLTFQDLLLVRTIQRRRSDQKNLVKSSLRLYPTGMCNYSPKSNFEHELR